MEWSPIAAARISSTRIAIAQHVARIDFRDCVSGSVTYEDEAILGSLVIRGQRRSVGRMDDATDTIHACGLFTKIEGPCAIRRAETPHALSRRIAIRIQTAIRARGYLRVDARAVQARVDRAPIRVVGNVGIIIEGSRSTDSVTHDDLAVARLLYGGTRR